MSSDIAFFYTSSSHLHNQYFHGYLQRLRPLRQPDLEHQHLRIQVVS